MKAASLSAAAAILLGAATASGAADGVFGTEELRRNGAISRHAWTPGFARTEIAGCTLSAGLALGLRRTFRAQLDTVVAPGLRLELDSRSNLTLLAGGKRSAMLVWQRSN